MLKVSVIVPVYNVERYLKRCIKSVLNQTYDNIELILVDDGSTDSSSTICDEFQRLDRRIVVIHKENGGLSSARNAGVQRMTGEYCMFLDSDDAIDLDCIERCIQNITGTDDLDLLLFGYHMYQQSEVTTIFQRDIVYECIQFDAHERVMASFLDCYKKGYYNFSTDKLYRSQIIKDHNIHFKKDFDNINEDAIFILDLLPFVNSIKTIPYAFYQYYRRVTESTTQLFRKERFDKYYDRIGIIHEFMVEQNCFDGDYLVELFGSYFLWAYESTFHPSCDLSLFERMRYIRNSFRKNDVFPEQRRLQNQITADLSAFNDYSKSSLIALRLFYKRHFLLLSIWNVLTAIKLR